MNRVFAVSMIAVWGVLAGTGMALRNEATWLPFLLMCVSGIVAIIND